MSARAIRRAAERKAEKLARKAGVTETNHQPTPAAPPAESFDTSQAEIVDFPNADQSPLLSEAMATGALDTAPDLREFPGSRTRLAANRENALKSTGPTTPEGKAIASQNRLAHGLARHNGRFALLPTEDAADFASLRDTYFKEHVPTDQTEADLIHGMVEALWLRNRAQNLQPQCFDLDTGAVRDAKNLALYIRYENTYNRAFSTALKDLLRVRAEKRKINLGFEAQQRQEQAEIRPQEKHQMKKDNHASEVLKKDAQACRELTRNLNQKMNLRRENPEFLTELEAEFAKHNIKRTNFETGIAA